MDFEQFGGRRFLLTVSTQISVTALVWAGKISDDVYSVVTLGTVAVFIAGATAQSINTNPAITAPSESRPSGISIESGLSCG